MDGSLIQPYDILMLVVIVATTAFGALKGLAWQVASFASFVLSYLVAARCSGMLAPYLSDQEPWNHVLAMLILFVATSAAVWIVFRFVSGAISRVKLKEFDRQLGAMLGVLKGVLFCLVITFFAVTLSEGARQKILQSRSGYYIAVLIDRTGPVLPESVRGVLGKYIDELDRKLDPAHRIETPVSAEAETDRLTPPANTELSSQLGIDRVQDQIDGVQQGVEGVRRRLDGIGGNLGSLRDSLRQAADEASRGVEDMSEQLRAMPLNIRDSSERK